MYLAPNGVIFQGRQVVDRGQKFEADDIAAKIQDTMSRRGMCRHRGRDVFECESGAILREAVLLKRGQRYTVKNLGEMAVSILIRTKSITELQPKTASVKKPKAAPEDKRIKAPLEDK